MSTETCTVRPELIEFDKPNDSKFLSIVAHADGFKFLDTATATNTAGDIDNDLSYDTANLASMFVNTVNTETAMMDFVQDVKTFTMLDQNSVLEMSSGNMSNVGTFTTDATDAVTISSNIVDMNQTGQIQNVGTMSFYEAGEPSMTITNDHIMFGAAGGIFNTNGGQIDHVQTMTMIADNTGVLDVSGGNVDNVLNQNMSDNGVLTFSVGGTIDIKDGVSHLGELDISANVIANRTAGASVLVESSVFEDANISTTNIKALGSEVNVVDATFGTDKMTVTNIFTSKIASADAGNVDLMLEAPGTGVINCGGSRISNVLQPVSESDVANKAYVTEAVANNIQGLKPKKACDYAIFGNQLTSGIFSTAGAVNFALATDLNNESQLVLITMSNTDIVFSGVEGANLNDSFDAEQNNLLPKVSRKRILINGLNHDNYEPTIQGAVPAGYTKLTKDVALTPDLAGLNGIWEVVQYDTSDSTVRKLILVRAEDMNENKEMMNNAYTYLQSGTADDAKANFGYVVTNGDPIILYGLYTKMLTNPADYSSAMMVKELKWEIFNSVNYELDFIDSNNERREGALAAGAFAKGGLLMRSDPGLEGEKQIMVNANMLNYDVETNLLTAKGDVNLVSSNVDTNTCIITAFAADGVSNGTLNLNGATVSANVDGGSLLKVEYVEATSMTCESDKTLKTNIEAMLGGLDLVGKFKPVTYQWVKDPSNPNPEYGFIAQDVQEPFPTLVKENSDSGVLSVDYMKITSILVAAVQELSAEVKSLKTQLNA
jgi:hypothetical protein